MAAMTAEQKAKAIKDAWLHIEVIEEQTRMLRVVFAALVTGAPVDEAKFKAAASQVASERATPAAPKTAPKAAPKTAPKAAPKTAPVVETPADDGLGETEPVAETPAAEPGVTMDELKVAAVAWVKKNGREAFRAMLDKYTPDKIDTTPVGQWDDLYLELTV